MPPTTVTSPAPRPALGGAIAAAVAVSVIGAAVVSYGVFALLDLTVDSTAEFCERYKCGLGAGFTAMLAAGAGAVLAAIVGMIAAVTARRPGGRPMRAALIGSGVIMLITFVALLWWTASGPLPVVGPSTP